MAKSASSSIDQASKQATFCTVTSVSSLARAEDGRGQNKSSEWLIDQGLGGERMSISRCGLMLMSAGREGDDLSLVAFNMFV